jgi:rhodanese-related sulfurtransferase
MVSEITVEDLAKKLKSQDQFILLDVRELSELEHAKIMDARLEVVPMSRLAREGMKAFSESAQMKGAEIYVLCHTGSRSMQVTAWLASRGWTNVHNVSGGIDAFAQKINPAIGVY